VTEKGIIIILLVIIINLMCTPQEKRLAAFRDMAWFVASYVAGYLAFEALFGKEPSTFTDFLIFGFLFVALPRAVIELFLTNPEFRAGVGLAFVGTLILLAHAVPRPELIAPAAISTIIALYFIGKRVVAGLRRAIEDYRAKRAAGRSLADIFFWPEPGPFSRRKNRSGTSDATTA
jgi:hypothetical protein